MAMAVALPAAASTSAPHVSYTFRTLNNSNDETFNQLLGINKRNVISGYFGSGARGHKNKGYLLKPPYRQSDYVVENFPNSAQTQVTGLNDKGVTVGFFSHTNKRNPGKNANFGFYERNGHFHQVNYPTSNPASPPVDQLLGVNDSDIAVGFFVDAGGVSHGYEYNIKTGRYSLFPTPSSAVNVTATGINNNGDVCGFFNNATGPVKAFLFTHGGHLYTLAEKGVNMTQAFGVNDSDEVVGATTVDSNTYGFTWTPGGGFSAVNDPHGVGTTVVNGVNDAGDLVGFYTASNGRTDGMLAKP
jgi:probable HAF family extracellular repeat protein